MPDPDVTRRDEAEEASGRLAGPLSGLRLGIAGPGRVGRSFACWARAAGAELALVVRRTPSAPDGDETSGAPTTSFEALAEGDSPAEPLDVLLLSVSDAALAPVAAAWATAWASRGAGRPAPFRTVLHSSGCFDAEVLAPLRDTRDVGVAVGSLHPLRAFPDVVPEPGPRPFFAVDGDPQALDVARRLVRAWGGSCCELSGERRVVYHLAASLAAGGVVTTLAVVTELMRRAELPDEVLGGYLDLLRGAVAAAESAAATGGPGALASAITGPAARGDEATLERHGAALRQIAPELAPTVAALWRETRRQSGSRGT